MLSTSSPKSVVRPKNTASLTLSSLGESQGLNDTGDQWQASLPDNSLLAKGAGQRSDMMKEQPLAEPNRASEGDSPKGTVSSSAPQKHQRRANLQSKGLNNITNKTATPSSELRVLPNKTVSKSKGEAGPVESTIHSPNPVAAQPTESTITPFSDKSVRAEPLKGTKSVTNQPNDESLKKENHSLLPEAQRTTSEGNRATDVLEPGRGIDFITTGQIIHPPPLTVAVNNSFVQVLTELSKPVTLKPDTVTKVSLTDTSAAVSILLKGKPETNSTSVPEKGTSQREKVETGEPSGALSAPDSWQQAGQAKSKTNMGAKLTIPPTLRTEDTAVEQIAQEPPVELPEVEGREAPFEKGQTDTETDPSAASPITTQEPKLQRGWPKAGRAPPQPKSPETRKPELDPCSPAVSGVPLPMHCPQHPARIPGKALDICSHIHYNGTVFRMGWYATATSTNHVEIISAQS